MSQVNASSGSPSAHAAKSPHAAGRQDAQPGRQNLFAQLLLGLGADAADPNGWLGTAADPGLADTDPGGPARGRGKRAAPAGDDGSETPLALLGAGLPGTALAPTGTPQPASAPGDTTLPTDGGQALATDTQADNALATPAGPSGRQSPTSQPLQGPGWTATNEPLKDTPPATPDGVSTELRFGDPTASGNDATRATAAAAQAPRGQHGAAVTGWRSTVMDTATLQQRQAPAQTTAVATQRATTELASQTPSTWRVDNGLWVDRRVRPDASAGLTPEGAAPVPLAVGGLATESGGQHGQPGHAFGGAPDLAAVEGTASRDGTQAPDEPDLFSQELADAGDASAEADAAWGAGSLRHASLRVGDADSSIDIQLALQGQSLSVDFRTDDAHARASLAQHASTALSDLLQRSGIALTDVSVGAQAQGQGSSGQDRPGRPAANSGLRGISATEGGTLDSARATPARRPDGDSGLDLFV